MPNDIRTGDESMRERCVRLREENRRLQAALDAAKQTAEIERRRAADAEEASRRAWRIAGGYR